MCQAFAELYNKIAHKRRLKGEKIMTKFIKGALITRILCIVFGMGIFLQAR